jgi:peroxiredoxin
MKDGKYVKRSFFSIFLTLLIVLMVAAAGLVFISCSGGQEVVAKNGDQVDFTLPDLDGNTVDIKDYRGNVVVLNFWATWCPPCRAEIPDFIEVYDTYKDRNVVFFGISADDFNSLKGFAAEYGMPYPTLFDEDGDVHYSFRISAIPHTFILDEDGSEVFNQVGMMSKQQLSDAIENAMQ